MDFIILCHTEFGMVKDKSIIFDKNAIEGVRDGVKVLVNIAEKYNAKITFAIMPEIIKYFPKKMKHEIGLHIHPGWEKFLVKGVNYYVGDKYLNEHSETSSKSTLLRDYSYNEQRELINIGKDLIDDYYGLDTKVFVAGRWSVNQNTINILEKNGFSHECSAFTSYKDWENLPRICMPYHPDKNNYQKKGKLSILITPISQMIKFGNVNPEITHLVGLPWLKACFLEYYIQKLPFFHICLHSPAMLDPYFISAMDEFLKFVSTFEDINFKFASEIKNYKEIETKTKILPYIKAINKKLLINTFKNII